MLAQSEEVSVNHHQSVSASARQHSLHGMNPPSLNLIPPSTPLSSLFKK